MKITTLTLLLLLFAWSSQAQVTLERQVIASGGASQAAGNLELSSTIGETATTTLTSGSFILTQGFQQGDLGATSVEDLLEIAVDYKIFPNPAQELLNVELTTDHPAEIQVDLYDLNGKALGMSHTFRATGTQRTSFPLTRLSEGVYILNFRDATGKILVSHKVQKAQ